MKLFKVNDRKKYLQTQIERSKIKFSYCKVSIRDVLRYVRILKDYLHTCKIGPIVCMGTRNGREVDLFRIALNASSLWIRLVKLLELGSPYPHSLVPCIEGRIRRSDYADIDDRSSIGVEINPEGGRKDISVGSFDDLPQEWTGRFGVLFSNSFDHSIDPERTVREWVRVVRPGGMLIILWGYAEATETDLIGEVNEESLIELFKLRKADIHSSESICGYKELFLVKE